jgi:hypothetical protein
MLGRSLCRDRLGRLHMSFYLISIPTFKTKSTATSAPLTDRIFAPRVWQLSDSFIVVFKAQRDT